MSLRRKDDWDEALEEVRWNEQAPKPFVPGADYDYGMRAAIRSEDILPGPPKNHPLCRLPRK